MAVDQAKLDGEISDINNSKNRSLQKHHLSN